MRQIREAASDKVSGAESIATTSARALANLADSKSDLESALLVLLRGHPGMAPLWRLAEACLAADHPKLEASRWETRLETEYEQAATRAVENIPVGLLVTNSYSRTVITFLSRLSQKTDVEVLCARSEPGEEGERTGSELRKLAVNARVVDDQVALQAVADANAFVCGADAVMPHAVRNKVGTNALARQAHNKRVPCYTVTGESKFVGLFLPPEEALEDSAIELFTMIISSDGCYLPNEASAIAARFQVATAQSLLKT